MRCAPIALLAATLAAPAHAASPNMREGMWEITTKMEYSGRRTGDCPKK